MSCAAGAGAAETGKQNARKNRLHPLTLFFCALSGDDAPRVCVCVFPCAINRQLAGHPNIVQMLGFCDEAIVTEYYESFNGILFREGLQLPIADVVLMALDAARGLQVRLQE